VSRAAVLPLALLAGCVEPGERAAPWPYLHAAVIEPSCAGAGCHAELRDVDEACGWLVDEAYVVPFEPERSRLMHLLRGDDANLRMPPDAALPEGEIALVDRWILEGAACD
jgi:hypothetical protein